MGKAHTWGKPEILRYHEQSEPRWVTNFGYRKPVVKYTCTECGDTACGDGGSTFLIMALTEDTCGEPSTKPRNLKELVEMYRDVELPIIDREPKR